MPDDHEREELHEALAERVVRAITERPDVDAPREEIERVVRQALTEWRDAPVQDFVALLVEVRSASNSAVPVRGAIERSMVVSSTTVLVVEDEESFVDALSIGLRREGFAVHVARDGVEALHQFEVVRPDLVLLDVMLPRLSGIDVCREIGRQSSVPIIMVSAKTSEIETVVGLEVAADDYVPKPYRLRELVARMRAALRRAPLVPEGEGTDEGILVVGVVRLDRDCHEVFVRGEPVVLPLKEVRLLELLLANAGRVLTRDVLIDRVWGSDYFGDSKTLDVHVMRLRSRIETGPAPTHITTIRGLGYKFEAS